MRFVTSLFNGTLFRKNLTRYWPLWALYALIWLFAMPVQLLLRLSQQSSDYYRLSTATNFADWTVLNAATEMTLSLSLIFAVWAAMSVFSYLYNNRSANLIHSLPIRREGLFLTNFVSGYCFFLVPHLLVLVTTLLAEAVAGYVNPGALLMWFAVTSLESFFFYSFAVFCAVLTGHIIALPVFYGVFNGLVVGLVLLINEVLSSFVYGYQSVEGIEEFALWCTPVGKLAMNVSVRSGHVVDGVLDQTIVLLGLQYVLFYAVVGVVLAVAALLLYRKRHVETAGDVVSIAALRPVFRYGVAFCSALALGMLFYVTLYPLVPRGAWPLLGLMLAWGAVGYFAAEMFLQKSFRVFRRWKGCAVFLLLLIAGTAIMEFDLTGFERRVPDPSRVAAVTVSGTQSAPYDSGNHLNGALLTDPETIALLTELHQALTAEKAEQEALGNGFSWVGEMTSLSLHLDYRMESGLRVNRSYSGLYLFDRDLENPSSAASLMQRYLNRPDVIRAAYELDTLSDFHMQELNINVYDTVRKELTSLSRANPDDMKAVWAAILADFDAGNLGQRFLFEGEARDAQTCVNDLSISFLRQVEDGDDHYYYDSYFTVTLRPGAAHTIAALTELGLLDETHILVTHAEYPALRSGPPAEREAPLPVEVRPIGLTE